MTEESTVLIVDDYPDALDVWKLYLRAVGFNVQTAANGEEALLCVAAAIPDLVVLDLELPVLSGFDVARTLRSQTATKNIPLIAATGHSHPVLLERARQSGFDVVLIKPCDPDALVVEIRRLLAGSGPHRAAPTQ